MDEVLLDRKLRPLSIVPSDHPYVLPSSGHIINSYYPGRRGRADVIVAVKSRPAPQFGTCTDTSSKFNMENAMGGIMWKLNIAVWAVFIEQLIGIDRPTRRTYSLSMPPLAQSWF